MTRAVDDNRAGAENMFANARRRLLDARAPSGHWEGELSSSALSTATASFALWLGSQGDTAGRCAGLARGGIRWLEANQNADGGWGDTTRSFSNISTTALCWAALRAIPRAGGGIIQRAEVWLAKAAGSLEPATLARALSLRYGKDRTFSVPILTMCAAAGVLGGDGWRYVPQLPFELAALPRSLFAFLRLPVVSYALPALIAIGQVRHRRLPSRNPLARLTRLLAVRRTLRILERIQPLGGGFLEATPLTSFVVMSLLASGSRDEPVVARGIDFLVKSVRADGSWPIDTNLATWVTTLSVNALSAAGRLEECLPARERAAIADWLLGQQYQKRHPFSGAAPGGWAWTDLPGGVPDADDTAGALLALRTLGVPGPQVEAAACAGVRWLLGLQNRDGGIPTFCRGWGTLPFDRSAPELTAHALRAWAAWRECLPRRLAASVLRAEDRAMKYLRATQATDGSWVPLWFGNQAAPDEANPTHGTARVLISLIEADSRCGRHTAPFVAPMVHRGALWLLEAQNSDGGWGGAPGVVSSIEETGQAVHALRASQKYTSVRSTCDSIARGIAWLSEMGLNGRSWEPAPIGLYFAKLWYWERLYPLIALAALS